MLNKVKYYCTYCLSSKIGDYGILLHPGFGKEGIRHGNECGI
jgi:hypothetical protein